MAREPLLVGLDKLRQELGAGTAERLEFGVRHAHLLAAVAAAGIEMGAADRRVVGRLAALPAPSVQVLIGLISRANRD
jgi:hypothetical protein